MLSAATHLLSRPAAVLLALLTLTAAALAADLTVPATHPAASPMTISTTGTGDADLYLIGGAACLKQEIRLGSTVTIAATDLTQAGRYLAILRAPVGTVTRAFYVQPAAADAINFLAQPSRVPAAARDAISGTAFVMDHHHNLVVAPTPVRFELTVAGGAPEVRTVIARDGIASTRLDSTGRAGPAQFTASVASTGVTRIVQQTAADPCNLRLRAQPARGRILVETDPVRDCKGNLVPDGTVVTFTSVDGQGRSTIDAVIKRGIARADLPAAERATISAASGIVTGNEIRWGGRE